MLPTIVNECSQFLTESDGNYIIKNLPRTHQGFAKIKVRLGKRKTKFTESFNRAFETTKHDLHHRAIFAYTNDSLLQEDSNLEPFFIFPINGYEFIYNPMVCNSSEDYSKINMSSDLITDLLKLSYQTGTLSEALQFKCEIVFYGIPYYYAIRQSLIEDYHNFINT